MEDEIEAADAPDIATPSPELVDSLADLVRELNVLRIHIGNPSLRTLEKQAHDRGRKLAKSTIDDLLRGRRQPNRDLLLHFLWLCGVEPGPWIAAWQRALVIERGLARQVPAPRVEGAPPTGGHSTGILTPPLPTADDLADMPVASAAAALTDMTAEQARTALANMAPLDAAERITLMPAEHAAAALVLMAERKAVDILRNISKNVPRALLVSLLPVQVATALLLQWGAGRGDLFHVMEPTAAMKLMLALREPDRISLMQQITDDQALVRILEQMPAADLTNILADSRHGTRVLNWLSLTKPETAAHWLALLDPTRAVALMRELPEKPFAEVGPHISDELVSKLLHEMIASRPAKLLTVGVGRLIAAIAPLPSYQKRQLAHKLIQATQQLPVREQLMKLL